MSSLFFNKGGNYLCNYVEGNNCSLTGKICPYVYFCTRKNVWLPLKSMPNNCKVKENLTIPRGYYKVCFERHHNLYINMNGKIEIIPNPYEDTPIFVKVTKTKAGQWRIKRYEG